MRWLLRLVFILGALALIAGAGLLLMPTDRIAEVAERRFEAATGRALDLSGGVSPTLWPVVGVRTGTVTISDAPWAGAGPMVAAEALTIGLKPGPLIRGEIAIQELRLTAPRIRLRREADGRANWNLAGEAAPAAPPAAPADDGGGAAVLTLDQAVIAGGELHFTDAATGTEAVLTDLELTAALPEATGRAEISGTAVLNGAETAFSTAIDGFAGFLAGDLRAVSARLEIGPNSVTFDGRAGTAPVVTEGRLRADLGDWPALLTALGQQPPAPPSGLGRSAALSGELTYTQAGLALRGAELSAAGNTLRGEADLTFAEPRPRLVARLGAEALELGALAGDGGGGAGDGRAGEDGGGWSDAPIDVSALAALDAEIALSAGRVALGDISLDRTDLVARLDRSRLVFDITEIGAYGGRIGGQFVVNGRGGLSVGGDLAVADLQLQPFLTATAEYDRLIGAVDGEVDFLGVGNSVAAIMRSLSGSGRLSIGKGELLGLDLVGMLRNFDTSYRGPGSKTIFDAVTASFTISDGVLSNEDLLFVAPLAEATGAGTVDIGARRLDYRVVPVAFANRDGTESTGGVRIPVVITGSWDDPKFRPDLAGLIEQETGLDEEQVKEDLRGRVREKIEEEIGPVEEGQSLEDAVRDRIEDEARKKLLDFLGGGN